MRERVHVRDVNVNTRAVQLKCLWWGAVIVLRKQSTILQIGLT